MAYTLDIRQLKYFVGVVEAGSFTRAANRLNVAQSALSLHVRQMEEGFGTQLLLRDRTGVTVTDAGSKLMEHAQLILAQVKLAETELTSKPSSPSGEVTIGIPSGAARVMVAELLTTAKEVLPNVALKIVEGMTGTLEEWMTIGRFNLAILYRTIEEAAAYKTLALEEFCLVVPPGCQTDVDTIRLEDLQSFPLAVPMRNNNARRSVTDVIAQHGLTLDVRYEVDSLSTIISMVAEGNINSILTPSAIQKEVRQGQVRAIRIVDPVITRAVVLAVHGKDDQSVAVAAVRNLVPTVVSKLIENGQWPARHPD
jgi:LysR family transcriptional regulator, nitrogen assimilation regulatory protein